MLCYVSRSPFAMHGVGHEALSRTLWSRTDLSPQTGRPSSVLWYLACNKFVSSDTALTTAVCDVVIIAYLHTPLSLSISHCLPGTYLGGCEQAIMCQLRPQL